MTEISGKVSRRNDVLTVVDDRTYIVHLTGSYATTGVLSANRLWTTMHMSEGEARALLAGLQEALA